MELHGVYNMQNTFRQGIDEVHGELNMVRNRHCIRRTVAPELHARRASASAAADGASSRRAMMGFNVKTLLVARQMGIICWFAPAALRGLKR